MMHNTKRAIARRVLVYAIMVTVILGLTTALLLAMLGYRYNRTNNTITQGGLVQFISQPTGASVRVGTADLANRTRSKITLNTGDYKVVMSKDGYTNWEKDIDVQAGKVLWLNSARLVPQKPVTESVLTTKTLGSVVAHENGKSIALLENNTSPVITLINSNDDTVTPKYVTIPEASYSKGKKHTFELVKQSGDDAHILVRHTFDTKSEWLIIDTNSIDDSYVLASTEANPITSMQFDPSSDDRAYALYKNGDVRRIAVSDGEMSSVLVTTVADFTLTSSGSLFYTSLPSKGIVTTGYLTQGKTMTRTIDTFKTDKTVHIAAGEYYDNFYIVTSQDEATTIKCFDVFPSSDEITPGVEPDTTTTIQTPTPAIGLSFKNDGRLLAVQQARSMTTYDIELSKQADVPIEGLKKDLTQPVEWLDAFHFWNDASGSLLQYEYDGTNQASITTVAPGYAAAYSKNNKYLYTVGKTKDGFSLQRTRMIL